MIRSTVLGLSLFTPIQATLNDERFAGEGAPKNSADFNVYIAMLSISLIIGLPYVVFIFYASWFKDSSSFVSYIRNLALALVLKTFFTLIVVAVFILGGSTDTIGLGVVLVFECICINLVAAFWLGLTIDLRERIQRNFNSEPTMNLYRYGLPGVGIYFALMWAFVGDFGCTSSSIWLANAIRLLYLLIQLGLMGDIARLIMTKGCCNLDSDSMLLLRKSLTMMCLMMVVLWFRFGFSVGSCPNKFSEPYFYFMFIVDGLECALICPLLYFFQKWGWDIFIIIPPVDTQYHTSDEYSKKPREKKLFREKNLGVKTLERVYDEKTMGMENKETPDVVYSNVVQDDRLQKTLSLYKRLNAIPNNTRESMNINIEKKSIEEKIPGFYEGLQFQKNLSSYVEETETKSENTREKRGKKVSVELVAKWLYECSETCEENVSKT